MLVCCNKQHGEFKETHICKHSLDPNVKSNLSPPRTNAGWVGGSLRKEPFQYFAVTKNELL